MSEYFEQHALIQSDGIWGDRLFFYDGSDNLLYVCRHPVHKAATSRTDWYIWKYTFSTDLISRIEGPLRGSVDGRAALDWA